MKRVTSLIVALFALIFALAQPAAAQTRTWVSGVGDDINPCSRTAPCKTFAGAISHTAAGGEINCLDPGGFGSLTITKSITVNCTDVFGSTLNSGTNGFIINDSATPTPGTIEVVIRGVHINGAGTVEGVNGIRFLSGRSLVVENVTIDNQTRGISIQPSGNVRVAINNVTINHTAGGVLIQPTGVAGNARVFIHGLRMFGANGTGDALRVETTGNQSVAGIVVDLEDSQITGFSNAVTVITPVGANSAIVNVNDSEIYNNPGNALSVNGANSIIRVSNNTITTNGAATAIAGSGAIESYGDNRTAGNSAAPAFTPPTVTRN